MSRKTRRGRFLLFVLLLMIVGTVGCTGVNKEQVPAGKEETNKPTASLDTQQTATLTFYNDIGVPDTYYTDYIEPHIKRKFPNVTIKYTNASSQGNAMDSMIASNTIPDIILTINANMLKYVDLGALLQLDPLVKTNNIDLSVFRDDMMESLRGYYDKGELYVLPWTYGTSALFYNKDIFDRLGVEYPKNGMTWDSPELKSLIAKLSRAEGGQQIRGLEMNLGMLINTNQLSLPFVDPITEKATVNTDGWKRLIETYRGLFQITGNEKPDKASLDAADHFIVDGNIAMWAGNAVYPRLIDLEKQGKSFNWDIVTLPTFKEAPGMGIQYGGALYGIGSTTKNKDLAMHIIAHLTSADVQKEGGMLFRFPTLKSPEVAQAFGKGDKLLEDKNMKSLQINKIAKTPKPTKYEAIAKSVLLTKAGEVLKGKKDVNTALREAEEEINSKISAQKTGSK